MQLIDSQSTGIGHGTENRCQDYNDQTGNRVTDPQVKSTVRDSDILTPVLLEENREESCHHGGCKGGVGPVIKSPGDRASVIRGNHGVVRMLVRPGISAKGGLLICPGST